MATKKKKTGLDVLVGKRIAVYIRVSSTRQVVEGDSLEAQRNNIAKAIEYRTAVNNWNVASIEEYVDAGKSAKNQNRPQLKRLKRDIVAGLVDVVVVVKLDRSPEASWTL